jgi:hypothetical protein
MPWKIRELSIQLKKQNHKIIADFAFGKSRGRWTEGINPGLIECISIKKALTIESTYWSSSKLADFIVLCFLGCIT